jgi:hypothetical protein
MIKYLKELPEIVKTSLVIASLLGIGGGGIQRGQRGADYWYDYCFCCDRVFWFV